MRTTKWETPNNTEYGMNYALSLRVTEWLKRGNGGISSDMVIPNDFFECTGIIIHSYREVGTSLEVNVELRFESDFLGGLTKIGRLFL